MGGADLFCGGGGGMGGVGVRGGGGGGVNSEIKQFDIITDIFWNPSKLQFRPVYRKCHMKLFFLPKRKDVMFS